MKPYLLLFCCYIFLATAVILGYKNKKQFNHPSPVFFNTYGVDASHHQGGVDWKRVGKTKYKFVYLKATEAISFRDKKFIENYKSAKNVGLVVGGYHFWSLCKNIEEQFENIKSVIPRQSGDLVPALDIESVKGCEDKKQVGVLTEEILRVNHLFLNFYGKIPLIYTTAEFSRNYPEILSLPNNFWLRSLVGPPLFRKKWTVWQYYNTGAVEGFSGPVDLNVLSSGVLLESILQR